MKKITLKIFTIFLIAFALQVQAQRFPADIGDRPGTYKIKLQGQNLYLTLNTTTDNLEYQALLPGDDEKQVFSITEHPRGAHYVITSTVAGKGVVEAFETGEVTSKLGCKGNSVSTADSPTPVQQDQWNPTRGSGTEIFLENNSDGTAWSGIAKRRIADVVTPAAGVNPELNGGSTLKFDFIKLSSLSNEKFDTSSIFVSNPVNNEISIKGLTAQVKSVSVFSLIGKEVLTREVNGETSLTLDASPLSAGVYLIKMKGEYGSYAKKVVKQ